MAAIWAYWTQNRLAAAAALSLTLMALQFGVIRFSPHELPVRIVLPLTIALVPVALWPVRRYAGIWVIFVGLGANLAVILLNGGLMPIERRTVIEAVGHERASQYAEGAWMRGSKDVLVSGSWRAPALGDSIVVRVGSGGFVASPGDVVVLAGVIILGAEGAWSLRRRRPARDHSFEERLEELRSPPRKGAEGSATTPQ